MPLTDDERRQLKEMEADIEQINAAQEAGAPIETVHEMAEALNTKVRAAEEWLYQASQEMQNAAVVYDLNAGLYAAPSTPETQDGFVAFNVLNKNSELQSLLQVEKFAEKSRHIEELNKERMALNKYLGEQQPTQRQVGAEPTEYEVLHEQLKALERRMLVELTQHNRSILMQQNSNLNQFYDINLQKHLELSVLTTLATQKSRIETERQSISDLQNRGEDFYAKARENGLFYEYQEFNESVSKVSDVLHQIESRPISSVSDMETQARATDILSYYQNTQQAIKALDASLAAEQDTPKVDAEVKQFRELYASAQTLYNTVQMHTEFLKMAIQTGESQPGIYKTLDARFKDIQQLMQDNNGQYLIAKMTQHENPEIRAMAEKLQEQNIQYRDLAAEARSKVAEREVISVPPASAVPKHISQKSEKRPSLTETLLSAFLSKPSEKDIISKCETLDSLKQKIEQDIKNMNGSANPVKRNDAKKKLLGHITQYEKGKIELDKMQEALTASGKPLSTETAIKIDAVKSFHHEQIELSQLKNYYQLGQPSSRGATPTRSESPMSRSESPMSISPDAANSRPSTPVRSIK